MPVVHVSLEAFKVLVEEAKALKCSLTDLVDFYVLTSEEPEEEEEAEAEEGEEEEEEEEAEEEEEEED